MYNHPLQGIHVLFAGINPRVLSRGISPAHTHFTRFHIQPAFVPVAVRATPGNPFSVTVACAVMNIGR